MKVFRLRSRLISDHGNYVRSFIHIQDPRIWKYVEPQLGEGLPLA